MELVAVDTVPAPMAFLVTGVPGSGKTTVSGVLARRFPMAAQVPGDTLAHLIVAGRRLPSTSASDPEHDRQLFLRARNAALLCDSFFQAGFTPVVDDVVVRRVHMDWYLHHLRSRPLTVVVLAPTVNAVLSRDLTREQRKRGIGRDWIALYEALRTELDGLGMWVDSTGQSPDETVDEILARAPEQALRS